MNVQELINIDLLDKKNNIENCVKKIKSINKKVGFKKYNKLIKRDCLNQPGSCIVAEKANKIIGYVLFRDNYVFFIAVDPESAKKGVGTDLLKRTIEILKAKNINTLQLDYRANKPGLGHFYEKKIAELPEVKKILSSNTGNFSNGDPKREVIYHI